MPIRRFAYFARTAEVSRARRRETASVLASAHVLITCHDTHGQQVEIPHHRLRRSFTGIQEFSRAITALHEAPAGRLPVETTIMQLGPSCFDFQFEVKDPQDGPVRSRKATRTAPTAAELARSIAEMSLVGQALVFVAAHPGCELRTVDTPFGPLVGLKADGVPHLILRPELVAVLAMPEAQECVRTAMAVFADPAISYVTLLGEAHGVQGMDNAVLVCNDAMREFIAGAPLRPTGLPGGSGDTP